MFFSGVTLILTFVGLCAGQSMTFLSQQNATINSTVSPDYYADYDVDIYVNSGAVDLSGPSVISSAITKMGSVITQNAHTRWSTGSSLASAPQLVISKYIEINDYSASPDTIKVTFSINNTANTATGVVVHFDLSALGLRINYNTLSGDAVYGTNIDVVVGEIEFNWEAGNLAAGQYKYMEFTAIPTGNEGKNLASGASEWFTAVYYNASIPIFLPFTTTDIGNITSIENVTTSYDNFTTSSLSFPNETTTDGNFTIETTTLDNLYNETTVEVNTTESTTNSMLFTESTTETPTVSYTSTENSTVDFSSVESTTEAFSNESTTVPNVTMVTQAGVIVYQTIGLGPAYVSACFKRVDNIKTSILYQHGFTALTFFIAFFAAIAVVILIACLCLRIRRRRSVKVKVDQSHLLKSKSNTLMMDADLASKKKGHTITDYSNFEEDDTIVGVLAIKDPLRRFREIDNLDIVCTVNVDTELEQERNDASITGTNMLINGLVHNRDITPGVAQAADNLLKQKRTLLNNNLDEEYKRQMKKLYKKLAAKNKAKMSRTLQRQRDEKKKLASDIADLGDKERQQLQDMMEKQHQTEIDEETYKLKLEQDEETENLRKEFAVRKRMGMKEIQQEMLEEVIRNGQLSEEKADWLLKEHREIQKKIDAIHDEEIARQRLILEEKLERRKALAKCEEQQEDDHSDLLNTMASQQVELVQKGKSKKHGSLSPEVAAEMIENAKQSMITLKAKMDADREKQEAELRRKLGDLKKKQMNKLKNEQKGELQELVKSMETQTDGPIDPVAYADNKLKLLTRQRQERNDLENEIDEEQAEKLRELHENLLEHAKDQLERGESELVAKMKMQCDVPPERYEELMANHRREVERLQEEQRKSQARHQKDLQEKLAQRRKEWAARKEQEKLEQLQLREHEEKVVAKLVNNQMSMSEDERDRIMKEHEKQMVKIENSLTLNKLRQKRMLEEKLSQKRAEQMDKLQQKHTTEAEKKQRAMEHNAEESDEESQKEKLEMMKRQFAQKMAVIQGQKLDIDDELENVKVEMMKERALALKDQEERLGAMVAALQLSKAREMAKIEEQQKAINNLKSNLMDDLTERGILSNPECQAVIQRHKQAQDDLNKRMEQQRTKQEKLLKKRLQERLAQKEEIMLAQQEHEIRELLGQQKNKAALKIKKMLLVHKHMAAMEAFRNQLDREITQTLEDIRRKHEIYRLQEVQKQELEFVAGLIRVGGFSKDELVDVLHVLFPYKTEPEISDILTKIYDPKQMPSPPTDEQPSPRRERRESLADRVLDSQLSLTARSQKRASLRDSRRRLPSPVKAGVEEEERDYTYLEARPEPIGEGVEATMIEAPHGRLPPLETGGKKRRKKKKKVLKKLSHHPHEDDDEGF